MRDANAKTSKIMDLEAQIVVAKQKIASLGEDVQKQDRELKMLEADKDKWKKIALDSQVVNGAGEGVRGAVAGTANKEHAVATAREMEALKNEIEYLQSCVRYLQFDGAGCVVAVCEMCVVLHERAPDDPPARPPALFRPRG